MFLVILLFFAHLYYNNFIRLLCPILHFYIQAKKDLSLLCLRRRQIFIDHDSISFIELQPEFNVLNGILFL